MLNRSLDSKQEIRILKIRIKERSKESEIKPENRASSEFKFET